MPEGIDVLAGIPGGKAEVPVLGRGNGGGTLCAERGGDDEEQSEASEHEGGRWWEGSLVSRGRQAAGRRKS